MSSSQLKAAATGAYADGAALLQPLLQGSYQSKFDPDAWHVMQERDNALIRDELMHGTGNKAFVYSFDIGGKKVTGISVVGARELASQYKGIKSRIVATVEKRGALFIFRTFTPLSIETRQLHDLSDDDDFYECVMEVSDIKTGNSIEVRKKESRSERKRDGSTYDRPHYDVICESKAYRNGVLSILPQSVIKEFQAKCLAGGNTSDEKTIGQLRSGATAHAAKNGIALDRGVLEGLTYDEVRGLGGAAAQGLDAFKMSAAALGLIPGHVVGLNTSTGEVPPPPPAATPRAAGPTSAPKPTPAPPPAGGDWEPTAEQKAAIQAQEEAEAARERGEAPAAAATTPAAVTSRRPRAAPAGTPAE